MQEKTALWASDEFGDAELGDLRRRKRLLMVAAQAAESPSGVLTEVFPDAIELEGAYRLIENVHVDHHDIGRAAFRATARRTAPDEFVFVPVDGSNITVPWAAGSEAFGPVGASNQGSRGIEVMNAIAVTPAGTPLGLAGQQWWVRRETADKTGKPKKKNRPLHKKETQHWFHCVRMVEAAFEETRVETQRWYQLDAGADFGEMLYWAATTDALVTVRAAQDRRLLNDTETSPYLWETTAATPLLGVIKLDVKAGRDRQARVAHIELRSTSVELKVRDPSRKSQKISLVAVLAREVGTTPPDEDPIEWLLLTNYEVRTFKDARLVVYGYSRRWTVEAFHKTWKDTCKAEHTLMQTPATLISWSMILACVAMRIERLTHLARETPDVPATEELTQNEIDAVIVLHKPKGYSRGDIPTIGEAVDWIAKQGGYRGKSSGGPPGTKVIGRGLHRVEIAAQVLNDLGPGS